MTRKTREAVQAALNHLENALSTKDGRVHFSDMVRVGNARALLAEALAEPERECDVGTPEEQSERWWKFCNKHFIQSPAKDNCAKCPVRGKKRHCKLAWAQMPYEESEAK